MAFHWRKIEINSKAVLDFATKYLKDQDGLSRMGSNVMDETSNRYWTEGSETTIEINIKTMVSKTYTLRVNKHLPVPQLKEQTANIIQR
ncbi:hypothetical protein LguiB_001106 [Lonicera macranthoides]